jgi:hypothetical protein
VKTRYHDCYIARANTSHDAFSTVAMGAGLLSLLVLLVFPLQKTHHFTARLRTPQTLSQVERHIFVAQPKAGPAQGIANCAALFTLLTAVIIVAGIKPFAGFEWAARVPLRYFLLRLKLGSSRSSSTDPLL